MPILVEVIQWYLGQSPVAQSVEALIVILIAWRSSARWLAKLPNGSPALWKDGSGILGSHRFSTARAQYLAEGIGKSPNGQFSFWHGGNHIVVVSGEAARTSFQMGRGLDPGAGFAALFGSFLDISDLTKDSMRRAMLIYKRCTQTDHLTANMHRLVSDSNTHMCTIPLEHSEKETSAIIDPQMFLGRLIYQLTHRVAGVHEIANDPTLLRETWEVYTPLEDSPYIDIMMPWLPTPSKMRKIWGYAKLHFTISRLASERQVAGRRESDMLQMLIDAPELGTGMQSLSVIGAVLAGVFNTTFSTVYTICQLACERDWLDKVRAEIDAVIQHGHESSQAVHEPLITGLQRLSVRDWETRFPSLRAAIAESIRFTMAGAVVRKNISPKDLEIGVEGLIIPRGSLAVHATADTHMDESIYPEPQRWNPSRFLGPMEGKEVPHGYLGWGSGNHPCPARRFAELNVIATSVLFITHFDFHTCDQAGIRVTGPLPSIIYNRMGAGQLERKVFLKCQPRS